MTPRFILLVLLLAAADFIIFGGPLVDQGARVIIFINERYLKYILDF